MLHEKRRNQEEGKSENRIEKEETNVKGRDKSRKYKKIRDNSDIYYVNIRGIKSKMESLDSVLEERKPDIVGIAETMLDNQEEINLRNDRNREGGRVTLAVKRDFELVTVKISRSSVCKQSIWIFICIVKIKLGLD